MNSDHAKDLLLILAEGCPNEPEPPLAMPLEPSAERSGLTCPACGGPYTRVRRMESVYEAHCLQCGCEFCPPMQSMAQRIVRSVMENERHRRHVLDIPMVCHKAHKRERQGGVGASHELAHKLLTQKT